MRKWLKVIILMAAAIVFSVQMGAFAAKAKSKTPAKKPAPAKSTSAPHVVLGTQQYSGENAQLGVTYTLGKDSPVNITLNKAEYSIEPLKIGDRTFVPKDSEKLLILHFTVQNPQKSELPMSYNKLAITAVDSKDNNWESVSDIGSEETKIAYDVNMKPAQKANIYTTIIVPAAGEIPKIMFKSDDDLVLRYDMRGKAAKLEAPYADPADKSGMSALPKVTGQIGTYYPLSKFAVKLDGSSFTDKVADEELEEGSRFLVLDLTAKNFTSEEADLSYNTFDVAVTDQDDVPVDWVRETYQASKFKPLNMSVAPGKEMKFRLAFKVPADTSLSTFSIKDDETCRTFMFDVSGVK